MGRTPSLTAYVALSIFAAALLMQCLDITPAASAVQYRTVAVTPVMQRDQGAIIYPTPTAPLSGEPAQALKAGITVVPSVVSSGQQVRVSLSWSGGNPKSGYVLHLYAPGTAGQPCVSGAKLYSTGTGGNSWSIPVTVNHSTYYCAVISDGYGNTTTTSKFYVSADPDPMLEAYVTVNPITVHKGQQATVTVSWTGGNPKSGYVVRIYAPGTSGQPCESGGKVYETGTGGNSLSVRIAANKSTYYCAVVRDGYGSANTTSKVYLSVDNVQPLTANISAYSPVESNSWTMVTVNASGGMPPYWLTLYQSNDQSCSSYKVAFDVQLLPKSAFFVVVPGTTCFYANVTDNVSDKVTTNTTIVKAFPELHMDLRPIISPSNVVTVGTTVTLTEHVSGGSGDFSYQWYTDPFPDDLLCDIGTPIPGATSLTYTTNMMSVGTHQYCFGIIDNNVYPGFRYSSLRATVTVVPSSNITQIINERTNTASRVVTHGEQPIVTYSLNGKSITLPLSNITSGGESIKIVNLDTGALTDFSSPNGAITTSRSVITARSVNPPAVITRAISTPTVTTITDSRSAVVNPTPSVVLPSFGRSTARLPPQILNLLTD